MNNTANTSIYAVDKETGKRCWVNSKTPNTVANDCLEGEMTLLMRDGQHPYFEGKQRRFDLQVQFRLKQNAKTMWYGVELDESLNLGTLQRMTTKAALGFCQKMNPGAFHSSISKDPCMVFKVDNSMDRIAQTAPGDLPPCLGEAVEESSESIQRRKKAGVEWNTNDTYTISCFSSYFDFLTWSIMNMPGLPTIDATKLVGNQPFRFVMYTLKDEDGSHTPENKDYIFNLELSNTEKTSLGPAAQEWIEQQKKKEAESASIRRPARKSRAGRLLMKGRLSMTGRLSIGGNRRRLSGLSLFDHHA
ncbi:expressed unknown protein [Seminavis robusta]|uniref:Domain of unknown function at the cortex 1 domain-containing protein n=1 Tax=Seminavis robusta TaxID=568900 RepID=A0A9N8HPA4_9STRA|nr:expressed unknown protein [Seminavis robusta]|eukprot:Sro1307_g261310.1 n/a (304) ;mRNA; r:6734-7645